MLTTSQSCRERTRTHSTQWTTSSSQTWSMQSTKRFWTNQSHSLRMASLMSIFQKTPTNGSVVFLWKLTISNAFSDGTSTKSKTNFTRSSMSSRSDRNSHRDVWIILVIGETTFIQSRTYDGSSSYVSTSFTLNLDFCVSPTAPISGGIWLNSWSKSIYPRTV